MYSPRHFRLEDLAAAAAVMRAHSFALLVTQAERGLFATHLPFLYDDPTPSRPHGTLVSHLARANPQWRDFLGGTEVLVVFQGVHGYISPTWYASHPAEPHVPTWNYEAVHAYGTPRVFEEITDVEAVLHRTVKAYEAPGSAYDSRALPGDFLRANAHAVVAFEIPLTRLEAKAKLSQNRKVEDLLSTLAQLERSTVAADRDLARAMRRANAARLETAATDGA